SSGPKLWTSLRLATTRRFSTSGRPGRFDGLSGSSSAFSSSWGSATLKGAPLGTAHWPICWASLSDCNGSTKTEGISGQGSTSLTLLLIYSRQPTLSSRQCLDLAGRLVSLSVSEAAAAGGSSADSAAAAIGPSEAQATTISAVCSSSSADALS